MVVDIYKVSLKHSVSHPGVRKVQVSVGRSPAEILQEQPAGGRELQRGEVRPALLLTGRSHHNAPVDVEVPVSRKGRFLVAAAAAAAVQRAVSAAVSEKPVQAQTQLQILDGLGPLLCRVTVQGQRVRGAEGHELLCGEVYEIVVFIVRSCRKNKGQTKQRQQRVSFCAKCNHDKIISHILVCVCCPLLLFPGCVWGSAGALRGLWEFRDWAFRGV